MKSKRTWRWVTRDTYSIGLRIWVNHNKPSLDHCGCFTNSHNSDNAWICNRHLHTATGLKIKPGECVKVEFKARIIK